MKRKVFVVGAFGFSNNQFDGQTIKTRNVFRLLEENYDGPVAKFDTLDVKKGKNYLSLLSFIWNLMVSKTVIIVPADHSLEKLFPVLYYLSKVFFYNLIHLCVGGWQVEFFVGSEVWSPHKKIMEQNKKIKAILPQISKVDKELKELYGFNNSELLPNFRFVDIKPTYDAKVNNTLQIVYMARVQKAKGYDVLIDLANNIVSNKINATIDIYGQVDPLDESDFWDSIKNSSGIVHYKGALEPSKIYTTLSNYDVLILPTKYYTEGFPGSILDSYLSGIPVIVTRWKHASEFVQDGLTGFIVDFDNPLPEIKDRVCRLCNEKQLLCNMKRAAIKEGMKYTDKAAWAVLSKYL